MDTTYLIDTPGFYYACGYWISMISICSYLPLKWNVKVTWGIRIVLLAALNFVMITTANISKVYFIPIMMIVICLVFLICFLTCDLDAITSAYYTVTGFITGELIASLSWQIFFYKKIRISAVRTIEESIIHMLICYLIAAIFLHFVNRNLMKNQNLQVGSRDLFSVLVCGVIVYTISNLSYLYSDTPFSSSFSKEVFIIRTLTDFGGVALLYAYHSRLMQMQYQMERLNLQNLVSMQYNNYKIAESSVELVNQKYHDLKHQIGILRQGVINNQEFAAGLERMEQEIRSYEAQNKTGNNVLDIILTSKSLYCQSYGIKLITIIDGAQLDFMDIMDISALFGNILDNAIENTMKVEDEEKRLIHLTITTQKGFLRVRTENYFAGDLELKDGLPLTQKKDKKNHGFGLKSIKKIVEKYHGSTTINVKNHWFELRILIPL